MPLLFLLIALVPLTLLSGLVLTDLWAWFIVPTFGLDPLSLPAAIGLSIIVGYLTANQAPDSDKEPWAVAIETVVTSLFRILFAWGAGAIVAQFM